MKKGLLIVLSVHFYLIANAQLYVDYFGHTVVGDYQNSSALFNVSSNNESCLSSLVSVESTNSNTGLQVWNHSTEQVASGTATGISVFCRVDPNRSNYGIQSYALWGDAYNTGSSSGLLSKAGYAKDGWNYGVCTTLLGPNDGAGIYASAGYHPDGYQIQGKWAGYFDDNVKVIGTLTATTVTQTSDYRLKENIRQLDNYSLNKLMDMNVVRYKLKNYEINMGDTATVPHYAYQTDSPLLKTDHFGLIAQELKEIYPELVVEGADGYLSINYMEIIPLLIKSVQELKAELDAINDNPSHAPVRTAGTTQVQNQLASQATLYQNNPNPFTENTTVRCIIPIGISKAVLYLYDMNGRQIDSIPIVERGDVSLTIEGNSLDAGIYLYSLITDGDVVDTKRLILTK